MTTPLSACCNAAIIVDDDPMEGRGAPIGSVSWSCSKCGKSVAKPPSSTPTIPQPASPLPWTAGFDDEGFASIYDANMGYVARDMHLADAAFIVALANAAARPDAGEEARDAD